MFSCVHVDKIQAGKMAEALEALREDPYSRRTGELRSAGIHRIVSFVSTEVPTDGDGLLVHVIDADDEHSVVRFFGLDFVQPIVQRWEGKLVATHSHDAVLKNIAVYDVRTNP